VAGAATPYASTAGPESQKTDAVPAQEPTPPRHPITPAQLKFSCAGQPSR